MATFYRIRKCSSFVYRMHIFQGAWTLKEWERRWREAEAITHRLGLELGDNIDTFEGFREEYLVESNEEEDAA